MCSGQPTSSSEKPPPIPGRTSALTNFKLGKDGSMTPRSVSFIDEVDGWKKKADLNRR